MESKRTAFWNDIWRLLCFLENNWERCYYNYFSFDTSFRLIHTFFGILLTWLTDYQALATPFLTWSLAFLSRLVTAFDLLLQATPIAWLWARNNVENLMGYFLNSVGMIFLFRWEVLALTGSSITFTNRKYTVMLSSLLFYLETMISLRPLFTSLEFRCA